MARMGADRLRIPVIYTNHYLPVNIKPSWQRRPGCVRCPLLCLYRRVLEPLQPRHGTYRDRPAAAARSGAAGAVAGHLERHRSEYLLAGTRRCADLRARYGLPPGRPLILSVGQAQPGEARRRAPGRDGQADRGRAAGRGRHRPGRGQATGQGAAARPDRAGAVSRLRARALTCPACTGWRMSSRSRRRRNCRASPRWKPWRPACRWSRPMPARSGSWSATGTTGSSPPRAAPTRWRPTWTSWSLTRPGGPGWPRRACGSSAATSRTGRWRNGNRCTAC